MRRLLALVLVLGGFEGSRPCIAAEPAKGELSPRPAFTPSPIGRVDVHTHIQHHALSRAHAIFGANHIVHIVNLSGGWPGRGLEESIAEARSVGHTTVFAAPDFSEVKRGGKYGQRLAEQLRRAYALGARGVKISKGLGLGHVDAAGKLVPIDDPGLDPLFETAGQLAMPVAIHSGDPKAFWLPPTPVNERYDELGAHPEWSFYDAPVSWEDLYAQFERRVARHKKTIFIGVHFGNDPEDPARVAQMLERYPNLYIDTAARLPEIGRVDPTHDAVRMRAMLIRFSDRILFGTDVGVGTEDDDLMLGSTGPTPPGPAEVARFFDSSWRYFETDERQIPSPTPIQGRWSIDGVSLPPEVLQRIYAGNASRLLRLDLR